MRVLTHKQILVLGDLEQGRIPVLNLNANTAASLMTKGAIIYHKERDHSLSYRRTKEAKALLLQQARLDRAEPYSIVRSQVSSIKRGIRKKSRRNGGRKRA